MKLDDLFEAAWWDQFTKDEKQADNSDKKDIDYDPPKDAERVVRHSGKTGDQTRIVKRKRKAPSEDDPKPVKKVEPKDLVRELKEIIKKYPDSRSTVVGILHREYMAKRKAKLSEMFALFMEDRTTVTQKPVPKRTLNRIQRIAQMMSFEQLRDVLANLR